MILVPISGVFLTQLVGGPEGAFRRVRLMGLMADSLILPVAGIFLGALLAEHLQQRRLRRFYSVFSGLAGLSLLLVTPLFLMDAIEVRAGVQPTMRRLYELNTVRSLLVVGIAGVILVLLAVGIWRALRRTRVAREPAGSSGSGLVWGEDSASRASG